ncbi:alpha/beta hydrolase [Actinomadura sp. NPDC048032]|uniref:alpha/beta hydrolase family protein n=1 Tax=Actinomadura sp. NPDC048032 TaxID=3155747 RepID=UPI0033DBDC60
MPGEWRVREVRFGAEGVTLVGLLGVPGGEAVAGVVLVGGSGPSDRDNDGYFRPIRRYLLEAGVAVLSYDKRGVGRSSGRWCAATMDDLASDALAALGFLRAQPEVRDEAAGLFGHSEGGWVALRAAARGAPSWVVTNSCPGVTPAEQERYALTTAARASGSRHERDVDSVVAFYDRLVEAGRRGAGFAEATRIVAEAGHPALAAFWSDVDADGWEFLKRKQDHDPLPDALRLRCPHLAIFGGADEVVPVAASVRLFSEAACDADRDHRASLTVQMFPGADHRVRRDGVLAPGYLPTLAKWIHAPG